VGVEDVDQQVDQDEAGRGEQHRALDHGVIALGDRLDHQPAEAGPGEDLLDHDLAAE
jgi:hypothetical protein